MAPAAPRLLVRCNFLDDDKTGDSLRADRQTCSSRQALGPDTGTLQMLLAGWLIELSEDLFQAGEGQRTPSPKAWRSSRTCRATSSTSSTASAPARSER